VQNQALVDNEGRGKLRNGEYCWRNNILVANPSNNSWKQNYKEKSELIVPYHVVDELC